ncbi:MAG: NAD(P)(+) transhydrogenase (Re/Si-specific) subunit beta [Ectothiorhodospiraceae bacterium]|jgi:NAD(P) transhydrogenase subunit beta|nr:NAD(P)(+) transhydrogenase (Re/Si-specific) subunit beta [Ectothiorhodospiraceae bacterium]
MGFIINVAYFAAAILFIVGLKQMSSPVTARRGIVWAGAGMVVATLVTFFHPDIHGFTNFLLIVLGIGIGGGLAWWSGKKVAMTDMPQMIALYNGMGGGAAAGIAAVMLMQAQGMSYVVQTMAVLGGLIGAVAFSGSLIAFAKLQGIMKKTMRFPSQQMVNLAVFGATVLVGFIITFMDSVSPSLLLLFFVLALAFGILMTLPIGGADMPVVISLYNALTGLAVGLKGFVLDNPAMMIAGIVVGAAGTLLTQLMAKAMNRPISNVLFSQFGGGSGAAEEEVKGSMKPIEASDAGVMMAFAEKVIIVPGYGMAVAQAQHKIWELAQLLGERGVTVKFAIHPVAGRMPGHMNVLLAEAGVPYDLIFDLDEINNEFKTADVALVIGANDVVNPVARSNPESPIYGMPILNADQAKNVIVIKRGQGAGFSGVENHLFYADNTRMLYGDGQKAASELIASIKAI